MSSIRNAQGTKGKDSSHLGNDCKAGSEKRQRYSSGTDTPHDNLPAFSFNDAK